MKYIICNGTGIVDADIPISMIPDVNNCRFTEECIKCRGTGKINDLFWL